MRAECPCKEELTQEFIQSVLDYKDGHFYWKKSPHIPPFRQIGSLAEHQTQYYTAIDIFPWSFSAAKLSVLWNTGTRVRNKVGHKNKDRYDNHIENLRWVDTEGIFHA